MKKRRHKKENPLTDFLKDMIGELLVNILWGAVKLLFRGVVHFIKYLF